MNILSITSSYPRYAGDPTAPFIESITKHVAALGHTVHLVVPEHSAWRRPASEDGVHYHPYRYSPMRSWTPWGYSESLRAGIQIRRRLYPLSPLIALSAIRTCNAVARRVPIDVIHAHWVIPNGPLAAVAARQHDVPLVVSVHGSDVALSERSRWMGSLTRRTFAQAFAVTAASRHMLDRAADLGARPETLHLIPYGMDLSSFQPDQQAAARVREALRLLPEDVLVLGIGRLIEWKGFGYLIQAIPLAQEKVPNIRLVIAGDGDLRAELEAQAQRLGLEDRVTFVGSVQRRDVPGFFAAADMVVVPSIRHEAGFVEALGYVVHEALATGTPVIASRVGGLPEVVGDGETGYLVEERDPEALAGAIATLASNQDLRMKMGVRARARALAEPDWDAVAERWIALYEQIVAGPPRIAPRSTRSTVAEGAAKTPNVGSAQRRAAARSSEPRPLNILVLTSAYPKFKGDTTAPFIASITEHIAAQGHTVHVVLPEHHELKRTPTECGVHFHPYRYSPLRSWTPWGYAQSLEAGVKLKPRLYALAPSVFASAQRTCNALAARECIDVVHAHWVVPNGTIAGRISARWGIPLVVTLHGSDMAISERSRWLGALARRAFAQAAAVTAPSFDLLERARHLGASGDLDLIPWGVDPDVFRPNDSAASRVRERYGLGVDDVLIVAAGRFIPVKGFDHLIRAMHLAQAHTLGVHLVLLGDGDLRNDLMAEAESLGLSNLVSFPGMTPHHAVAAHLAAADIVAVPSVHYKGFVDGQPTVALEAMAVGKPLIATRVGGLPEIVEDGENGLLVDEGDVTGLADAIRRLASTAKLRARMGEQSRRRVLESLTWDNVAGELVEVFERVRVQT